MNEDVYDFNELLKSFEEIIETDKQIEKICEGRVKLNQVKLYLTILKKIKELESIIELNYDNIVK